MVLKVGPLDGVIWKVMKLLLGAEGNWFILFGDKLTVIPPLGFLWILATRLYVECVVWGSFLE